MMDIRRILPVYVPLIVVVSCYFFPFEFTFLPKGLNTKIVLAVFGAVFFYFHSLEKPSVSIDKNLLWALIIVVCFCFTGIIAVDYNNTDDYSYALYIVSFFTWLGGAYAVYGFLKLFHRSVTFKTIMNYLIVVCVIQCVLALLIDLVEPLKNFVDTYVSQDTIADDEFLRKVNRLYAIGVALDVAGVRFSIVLIGLSVLVCRDEQIRRNSKRIAVYLLAFMVISIVGNIISRTTQIGMAMGILYIVFRTVNLKQIRNENVRFWWVAAFVGGVTFLMASYFYMNDEYFHSQLRYGFEGFFNWIEQGEWRTDSTDRLNTVMWVWPQDTETWMFGTGVFDKFLGSDIGYCRFVLYAGLPALGIFSLFFIYNAVSLMRKMGRYADFCLVLMALGFIIWLKVATDVFIMFALLYCLDREEKVAV